MPELGNRMKGAAAQFTNRKKHSTSKLPMAREDPLERRVGSLTAVPLDGYIDAIR